MNTQVTPEIRPYVEMLHGQIKTTSIKVAEHFGKRHDNVIKAIKALDCSPEFNALNFEEIQIDIDLGMGRSRKSPAYEMTKDGFTFLAMGFTGKEAAKWKEAYINAFNTMAEQLTGNSAQLPDPKTKKALPGCVTLSQQDTIKALVKQRVEPLPKDKQAGATIRMWSAIKKKFGVSYKEIPEGDFINVVSLIGRLPLEGELLPHDQTATGPTLAQIAALIDQKLSAHRALETLPAPTAAQTKDHVCGVNYPTVQLGDVRLLSDVSLSQLNNQLVHQGYQIIKR